MRGGRGRARRPRFTEEPARKDRQRSGVRCAVTPEGGLGVVAVEAACVTDPVKEAVAAFQGTFVEHVRQFAAAAIELGELPANEDPGRLAFELNGVILAADVSFVLHGDASLDTARAVVRQRLGVGEARRVPRRGGRASARAR